MNYFFAITFVLIASAYSQQLSVSPSKVSCNDKKIIVNTHNNLRNRVAKGLIAGQPPASAMIALQWDDNLEIQAQTWANNKVFQHSKSNDPRFYVGENIYRFSSTDFRNTAWNWNAPISAWFDENKLYKYGVYYFDIKTGHYTQVIWGNTAKIGCGASQYTDGKYLTKFYVCKYGPGGNIIGRYPYPKSNGKNTAKSLNCLTYCNNLYGNYCK